MHAVRLPISCMRTAFLQFQDILVSMHSRWILQSAPKTTFNFTYLCYRAMLPSELADEMVLISQSAVLDRSSLGCKMTLQRVSIYSGRKVADSEMDWPIEEFLVICLGGKSV